MLILLGKSMARINAALTNNQFCDSEFKVFSQFGDDGLIQYCLSKIAPGIPKTFVEFGIQDYSESNTRFLLQGYAWSGLVIDGSSKFIKTLRDSDISWRNNIKSINAWITKENIDELVSSYGAQGLGILSIDIDGNDYWIWEAIKSVDPWIVIVEWNALFGPKKKITVPYRADFDRTAAHHSNQFYGASLSALDSLAKSRGFSLVGVNSAGNNAYFIKTQRLGELKETSPDEAYRTPAFNDAREKSGKLSFPSYGDRINAISDCLVWDLDLAALVRLGSLELE